MSEEDVFTLTSADSTPCVCNIWNLHFHESKPQLRLSIIWISKGSYTNLQRKKLVTRTLNSILRAAMVQQTQNV